MTRNLGTIERKEEKEMGLGAASWENLEVYFGDGIATNEEIVLVVELRLARDTILGFRLDWIKHGLNPVREEKKDSFFKNIFSGLKINLENSR
jgi:hypothetical protein